MLIKLRMPQTWTCDACTWLNPGGLLCERCGQALHFQLDPPVDLPGKPSPAALPEFWTMLMWLLVTVGGALLLLFPLGERLGLSPWWLVLHLVIFGTAAASALNRLMFRLWFNRLELSVPAHARSGTMLDASVTAAPYETVGAVRITLDMRELRFNSAGQLTDRRAAAVELNAGAPLRGRRVHVFEWQFAAPVPTGRYMHLVSEMRLSFIQAAGRILPWVGMAAAQMRADGGWFIRMRVRRGIFVKVIEQRVLLYDPRGTMLVG